MIDLITHQTVQTVIMYYFIVKRLFKKQKNATNNN